MRKECKDHLGNVYSSVTDMCKCYGISQSTYYERLKTMNLEQTLTFPKVRDSSIKITDHLGNTFSSVKEMCEYHHTTYDNFKYRIDKGYSLKEALTPFNPDIHKCKDFCGNIFNTLLDKCKFYGISPQLYRSRIKKGWSEEKALCTPIERHIVKCEDHFGNKYNSLSEMLAVYNVTMSQYYNRKQLGWTVKDILENPKNMVLKQTTDHLGNIYSSVNDMCKTWNISYGAFMNRQIRGWSLEESLTIPTNMYIGEYRVAECLKRLNITFYHDCNIKKIFKDLNVTIDWKDFLESLQQNLEKAGINWSKSKIERLRPDFVLYTDNVKTIKGVIEFDGEQHQNFVEYFFKTIENFYRRIDSDFVKQDLWEYLNIPMLRIRHDQVDMIDDMVTDFISNPSKYLHSHNTYLSENEYWSILKEEKTKLDAAFT